jgi:hypothetical protein
VSHEKIMAHKFFADFDWVFYFHAIFIFHIFLVKFGEWNDRQTIFSSKIGHDTQL